MVYVFFATGFEEIEAITVLDILRRAQISVQSVGVGARTIIGAHGISVECDILEGEVSLADLTMIVLPGGMPGTLNLERSAVVQAVIDFAVQGNHWIAAICAAPSILGHRDLLAGKNATVFPGFEQELGTAVLVDKAVVVDEKFITSKGPGTALPFALTLVHLLRGKTEAQGIADSMQWGFGYE